MKRYLSLLLMFLAVAAFAACGGDNESGEHHDEDGHEHEDDHDDHEGHDHDDGEHGDEHGDHGERREIGTSEAGPFTVTVALFGEIEAGHEAVLDIEVEGRSCAAVRTWVGVESGRGSLKAKVDGEDGTYHGHAEVPETLPAGSAIWIEVEASDGKRSRTSFKIPGQ